ncbi:peptidoglycan DD-metalloendopeptidase family protein [Salinicola sp. DM10]|uniref:peptidoglycan DD-metalloendopeptidase family protein n=1 Tax=Salinicola sp. DM10 TaxID=2815721 RepID=UPI001A8EA61C|nr:peptidoglycan DD-metalloendopeptidase family protein [Salinicola sp. DM10]MCE3027358.1 peptidoglycan DD-metalloendopeptidase family protein [Salinicola sp. DM10]
MLRIFHSLPRTHKVLLLPVATMVTVLGTQKIIGVFDHADTAQTPISVASTATLSQSIIASAGDHALTDGHDKASEPSTLQRLSDDIPLAQLKPLEVMDVDLIPQAQASEDIPAASTTTATGSATAPAAPLLAATALKSALALGASGHDFAANSDSDDDIGGTSYEDWTSDGMLDPNGDPELGSEIASHEQYVPEWQSYTIQPGDSFALTAERTLGLEYSDVTQILGAVPDKKVLTRWRVGRTFDYKLDENGQLLALRVMKNPRDGYLIERDSETAEFAYSPIEKAGEATQRMFSGTVSGSFALSAQSTGLSSAEVSELTHVLSKKLDFRRDARAGDHFQVLVESDMIDGQSLDSKILAAKYEGQRMDLTVVRNSADDHFYTPDGNGLDPAFDRYPFQGHYRISSPFNLRRHHPVTGRISPHKGTDFAMRSGTPIDAPADGRVEKVVNHPLAGKYIVIRHDNGYVTRYLHLSKALVKPGERVKMGQEIALSGNTGRTTGPHLHYEILVNNRQVDAMRVKLPDSQKLTGKALAAFKRQSENLLAKLDQDSGDEPAIAQVDLQKTQRGDDSI